MARPVTLDSIAKMDKLHLDSKLDAVAAEAPAETDKDVLEGLNIAEDVTQVEESPSHAVCREGDVLCHLNWPPEPFTDLHLLVLELPADRKDAYGVLEQSCGGMRGKRSGQAGNYGAMLQRER